MSGVKHDDGKPRFDLIPPGPWEDVAAVFTHGAKKYSEENWRKVNGGKWRYLAAAYRHLNSYHRGEVLDSESHLPHLAHAASCLLILSAYDEQG